MYPDFHINFPYDEFGFLQAIDHSSFKSLNVVFYL